MLQKGFELKQNALDASRRRDVIGRLLREARPYYPRLAFSLLLGTVAGLGPLALTKAFPIVIDDVIGNPAHPVGILVLAMAGVFVVNLLSNLATYGQTYLTAWSGQRLISRLSRPALRADDAHADERVRSLAAGRIRRPLQ